MAPKGKSLEEKRQCILKLYHERKQPFNLKEIEKEGSKLGVVQQSIKDVNASLVDDKYVQNDKIGSGVFFWAFPSKALKDRTNEIDLMEGSSARINQTMEILEAEKREAQESRVQGPERERNMAKLEKLKAREVELNYVLEANKMNDPAEVKRIEVQANTNREHANRWVDNTWAAKSYLVKKKGINSKEADKYLGIKDDFDYFDDSMVPAGTKKQKTRK
jgi:hypothetical protein